MSPLKFWNLLFSDHLYAKIVQMKFTFIKANVSANDRSYVTAIPHRKLPVPWIPAQLGYFKTSTGKLACRSANTLLTEISTQAWQWRNNNKNGGNAKLMQMKKIMFVLMLF